MDIVERLLDVAADRSGDGPSGPAYDTELLTVMSEAADEISRLRGTQAADDERLATAAQRVGIVAGCDAAEWMADEIARLRDELERERMRLAACGVVALANTPDSAKEARQMHEDYWSASVSDVARMVDEQIRLRDENATLRADADECDALRTKLADILTRTANALKGEPGELQAHSWHDLPEWAQRLRKDAERLDWMSSREAWIGWTRDNELCRAFRRDEDGDVYPECGWDKFFGTARDAIDAAMRKGE